jgi:hypothetical protein
MVTKIEGIEESSSIKKTSSLSFEKLADLQAYLRETNRKDIETIIMEICEKEESLHQNRKMTLMKTLYRLMDGEDELSQQRTKSHLNSKENIAKSFEMALSVTGLFLGNNNKWGQILHNMGNQHYSSIKQKGHDATLQKIGHQIERTKLLLQDKQSTIRKTDDSWEKALNIKQSTMQAKQRLAELLFGR